VPIYGLDSLTIDFIGVLSTPESTDKVFILFDSQVQLASLVVLELRVVDGLLRNASAAPQPDTFDLEVGLVAEDQVPGEAVLAEVVEALQEPIAEVVCDVELLALALVLVVVEEPQGEAVGVELLLELLDARALLVLDVDEESLEVEEVEGCGRKEI